MKIHPPEFWKLVRHFSHGNDWWGAIKLIMSWNVRTSGTQIRDDKFYNGRRLIDETLLRNQKLRAFCERPLCPLWRADLSSDSMGLCLIVFCFKGWRSLRGEKSFVARFDRPLLCGLLIADDSIPLLSDYVFFFDTRFFQEILIGVFFGWKV